MLDFTAFRQQKYEILSNAVLPSLALRSNLKGKAMNNEQAINHAPNLNRALYQVLAISFNEFGQAPPHLLRQWLEKTQLKISRERNRGISKHYRYSLNRHIALSQIRTAIRSRLSLGDR